MTRFWMVSELPKIQNLGSPAPAPHTDTRGRTKLEQSEMIWILGLQRAHQNLKRRKLA
jgi:hypothetical protein